MLGTRQDLMKVQLGTQVSFSKDEQHLHAEIEGKDYVAQERDGNSFFLIGTGGILGLLIKRQEKDDYRVVIFKRRKMVL